MEITILLFRQAQDDKTLNSIYMLIKLKPFKMSTEIENAWRKFADESGGRFIERKYHYSYKVELDYNGWKILFDKPTEYRSIGSQTQQQTFTRVVTPFYSLENFKFEIFRKDLISSIAKLFGTKDIKIGIPEFDKAFVIKASDEVKMRLILSNSELRTLIEGYDEINLFISDQKDIWDEKLPKNEFELSLLVTQSINNLMTLQNTANLFKVFLSEFAKVSSAKSINRIDPI